MTVIDFIALCYLTAPIISVRLSVCLSVCLSILDCVVMVMSRISDKHLSFW